MGWSVRVATVAGTEVKIHLTFVLLLAWIGVAYYLQGGFPAAFEGVAFLILLFTCVLLHEFGHVVAARRYGIETPDITLLPIGGLARMARLPHRPGQELVVALAGPAVNLVLALLLGAVLGRVAGFDALARLEDPGTGLLAKLVAVNVVLFVFNLVPAFPMDGGRVLRALLALRLEYSEATRIAGGIGQAVALAFGFIGLFFNPLLIFVALFVYLGATQEVGWAELRAFSEGVPVREVMVRDVRTLPVDATLDDAVDALLATAHQEFPLVDAVGHVHGVLGRDALVRALRREQPQSAALPHAHRDVPSVAPHDAASTAFELVRGGEVPAVTVLDAEGQLVGLVTPANVGEVMMVGSARRRGASA